MGGHVACMGVMRNAYKIFIGNPEGKRPLGSHRRRWEENITVNVMEIQREILDWMYLARDRNQGWDLVNSVMNLQFPYKTGHFLAAPWSQL